MIIDLTVALDCLDNSSSSWVECHLSTSSTRNSLPRHVLLDVIPGSAFSRRLSVVRLVEAIAAAPAFWRRC